MLIFEGSSAEILFKGREPLGRGEDVMVEIIWVGGRLAIEDWGSVAMLYAKRRRFKDYEIVGLN